MAWTADEVAYLTAVQTERDRAVHDDDPIMSGDYDPMVGSGDDPE